MNKKEEIFSKVRSTIKKYQMLSFNTPVPVAFSGGKDSVATIFILQELGYDVRPVIVDRGDDPLFDSKKIARDLKEKSFDSKILKLRDDYYLSFNEIRKYLNKFDNLNENESHCTPCYNARTIALTDYSLKIGADNFVIRQHKNDMITSLMKCYWTEQYYNKFTKNNNIPYNGFKMKKLIENNELDMNFLENMVNNKRATTDDPPVEIINKNVKLIRPLENVSEREIIDFVRAYPYDSNNCKYRQNEPRPFRLIVQFDLEKRIEKDSLIEDRLYKFVLDGLKKDGTLKHRPRNKREEWYSGFKPFIEKL
jgi:tRNA(Ile)-lysidine synthase TilS/MesJ